MPSIFSVNFNDKCRPIGLKNAKYRFVGSSNSKPRSVRTTGLISGCSRTNDKFRS